MKTGISVSLHNLSGTRQERVDALKNILAKLRLTSDEIEQTVRSYLALGEQK